jgi:ubiquinone/menaquinone biosynthesis C-methylase UbiE
MKYLLPWSLPVFNKDAAMKRTLFYQILFIVMVFNFNGLYGQEAHEHEHAQTGMSRYEKREEQDQVRMYWQMPNRVLHEIGVESGFTIADVGCGIGYFSVRLAHKVGKSGIVYASDIDHGALTFLNEKAERQNIRNLKIIQGKEDDPLLPDSTIDIVLIVNTVHLIDRPSEYLSNLKSCLLADGRVVFVQWDAEKMDSEAPDWSAEDREKYTQQTLLRIIYDAGFEVKRILDFLPMQLIYICCPSKP